MENILPRFVRPIAKIEDPISNVDDWDKAVEAFDDQKYKASVHHIINYINPNLIKDQDEQADIDIVQMQGSAEIHIKLTDELFSIKAPFLKITDDTNRVALLRRVAEVNFTPLRLEQIHLKDDKLCFEYQTRTVIAQPNKVYDVLQNVAIYADKYDDEFIEKYKAEFNNAPNYTPFTQEEKDIVWQQISDIFEDYKDLSALYREKRLDGYIWDILYISFLKISNMPYVHGKLRSDLISIISLMTDTDVDFKHRVDKATNFMKKLLDKSREEIMKNFYHAQQFISLRRRSNPQIISDRLKKSMESVQKDEKNENYFNLSSFLQSLFLRLIYDYNLEDSYKQMIYNVLEEVSGLKPEEAAPKLVKVYYTMYNDEVNQAQDDDKKDKEKGFFSKLFG